MPSAAYAAKPYRELLNAYRRRPPICHICGLRTTAKTVTVDHVKAVSSFPAGTPGGVISSLANLRPAHRACNERRGARPARRVFAVQRDPRYS